MKVVLNHILRLFILLAIIVLLFVAGRIILYFSNSHFFEVFGFFEIFSAILSGVEYDFLVVFFVNCLFILLFLWPSKIYNSVIYQSFLKFIFFLFNAFALLVNLFDVRQFQLYGHRLRAFELKTEIALFMKELEEMPFKEIVSSYLNLVVYFIIFLFIIKQSTKLIHRIPTEEKRAIITKKWLGFVIFLAIAGILIFAKMNNENYLTKLYLKADRKLAPVVLNNPYLLISTYGTKQIEIPNIWGLDEFLSTKKYHSDNEFNIQNIKLIIIEQINIQDVKKDDNFFPLYTLKNEPQSIFQLLDEVFLSFPGIHGNGFYQSPYSLNKFESLIDKVKEKSYDVQLTVIGYPLEVEELVRNFYGFGNKAGAYASRDSRIFEVILINAKANENNIVAAGTDMIEDNEVVIRLSFERNDRITEDNELKKTISFTSLKKPPFYKSIDSIVSQPMDIKPSILRLIGYDETFTTYGNSLFDPAEKVVFRSYTDSSSVILIDSLLLSFSNNETIELNKLKGMKINAFDFKDSLAIERIILENKIQSILNDFNQRLKNNSL